MKKVIMLILFLAPLGTYACEAPPPEQHVPASVLISRTKDIVLARVVKVEVIKDNWNVRYTFKTVQLLKGHVPDKFTIVGEPTNKNSFNNFNNHEDAAFWDQYGGREFNGTDCEITPSFGIGLTYLVFLNRPYHSKSFELIIKTHELTSEIDKWLKFVEQRTP